MNKNEIDAFLAKKSKASIVLEMLLNREYVTASDIIKYRCEGTPLVFTTCPHKLIETIRKAFGADFVQDREVEFFRTMRNSEGKEFKQTERYKQYFLNKLSGGVQCSLL